MTKPVPAASGRVADLITEYASARTVLSDAKARLVPLQTAKDAAEAALFDFMENQDLRSVRHGELGLFILSDLAEPVMEDPRAFVAWAEDTMPELLTANRSRLAVVIREVLRGERSLGLDSEMPPGVAYTTRRTINWRRS